MAYATREDVESIFGARNVIKWADLDNENDAGDIDDRVTWALDLATEMLDNRLFEGPYVVPFDTAPLEVVQSTARLAGVLLYEARGIPAVDGDGNPINQVAPHKKAVDDFVKGVMSGTIRFAALTRTRSTPKVIKVTPRVYDPLWCYRRSSRDC